jgi:hypothetical protein
VPTTAKVFLFFQITDPVAFCNGLKTIQALNGAASTLDALEDRNKIQGMKKEKKGERLMFAAVNWAFSATGLTKLNVTDNIQDPLFVQGQKARASAQGGLQDIMSDWIEQFNIPIDGLVITTGNPTELVQGKMTLIQDTLGTSINELFRVDGHVRPGDEKGHEHCKHALC